CSARRSVSRSSRYVDQPWCQCGAGAEGESSAAPWRQYWPPNREEPSTRVTDVPSRTSSAAAAMPAGPAPMTTAPTGAVFARFGSSIGRLPSSGRGLPVRLGPAGRDLHPVGHFHQAGPLRCPAVDGGQAVVTDADAAEEASGRAEARRAAPGQALLLEQESGGDGARRRDGQRRAVDGDAHRPP